LLAFTSKEEGKEAAKTQCVFIRNNIISEILKDDQVRQKKALQK